MNRKEGGEEQDTKNNKRKNEMSKRFNAHEREKKVKECLPKHITHTLATTWKRTTRKEDATGRRNARKNEGTARVNDRESPQKWTGRVKSSRFPPPLLLFHLFLLISSSPLSLAWTLPVAIPVSVRRSSRCTGRCAIT